jgi:hypothetical protein
MVRPGLARRLTTLLVLVGSVALGAGGCVLAPVPVIADPVVVAPRPVIVAPRPYYGYYRGGYRHGYYGSHGHYWHR